MISMMASMSVERPSGQKGGGELWKEVNILLFLSKKVTFVYELSHMVSWLPVVGVVSFSFDWILHVITFTELSLP
jgi:hypothetical protein